MGHTPKFCIVHSYLNTFTVLAYGVSYSVPQHHWRWRIIVSCAPVHHRPSSFLLFRVCCAHRQRHHEILLCMTYSTVVHAHICVSMRLSPSARVVLQRIVIDHWSLTKLGSGLSLPSIYSVRGTVCRELSVLDISVFLTGKHVAWYPDSNRNIVSHHCIMFLLVSLRITKSL